MIRPAYILLFIAQLLALALPALAEKIVVTGELGRLGATYENRDQVRFSRFSPLRPLRLYVNDSNGLGRLKIVFNRVRSRDWSSTVEVTPGVFQSDGADIVLLQGYLELPGDLKVPAAGTIYRQGDGESLHLLFQKPGRQSIDRFAHLRLSLAGDKSSRIGAFSKVPSSVLAGKRCALEDRLPGPQPLTAAANIPQPFTTPVVVELRTVTDPGYRSNYNSSSSVANAAVTTFVNMADTIYQRDLDIELQIKSQVSRNTDASSNSLTALDNFKAYIAANFSTGSADANFLFTGTDFDGGVIGLAYLGVVCVAPSFAVGELQHFPSGSSALDWVIFAHELGHNLNADHTAIQSPPSIMDPALDGNNPPLYFATESVNAVTSFVNSNGSCLSAPAATPTGTPSPAPTEDGPNEPASSGNGGFDEPTLPNLPLQATFSKTGVVTLTGSADSSIPSSCELYLQVAENGSFNKGLNSVSVPLSKTSFNLTFTLNELVKYNKKKLLKKSAIQAATRLFLRFLGICPGSTINTASPTQRINGVAVKNKNAAKVTRAKFATDLADAIEAAL